VSRVNLRKENQAKKDFSYSSCGRLPNAGLVGYPNAGKSTLFEQDFRGSSKDCSLSVTTLNPMIGVVEFPVMLVLQLRTSRG